MWVRPSEPSGPPPSSESLWLARDEDARVHQGAGMQFFRNAAFSAPTSLLVLASLRHAVRLACFAAASPEGAAAGGDGVGFAAGALVAGAAAAGASARSAGGVAANPSAMDNRLRPTAAATVEQR